MVGADAGFLGARGTVRMESGGRGGVLKEGVMGLMSETGETEVISASI